MPLDNFIPRDINYFKLCNQNEPETDIITNINENGINNKDVFIIIPVHNEEKNIGSVIKEIKQYITNANIVVVNDGSKDRTEYEVINSGAYIISNTSNRGQWAALRTGFKITLAFEPRVIVTLDGDGQHEPKYIKNMINPILEDDCEFVIASRFIEKQPLNMSIYRYFGIKMFNYMLKIRTGMELTDCTNGFKAYNPQLIKEILPRLKENQYGALESLIQLSKYKIQYKEIPITSINSSKSRKGGLKYGINLLPIIINSLFTK